MIVLKNIRRHAFLLFIAAGYGALFLIRADMGVAAVKNSGYYIREMLLIMPVIFVLTGLLDTWVPKQTIMKYLGRDAGFTGTVFSFVLGAISAGPIYAAFPLCVMLHKKGASIRNVVIILSAWAVIKVPMLINEAKFLGPTFMAVRWILTVIAIYLFSWITAKLVKDDDIPAQEDESAAGATVNERACMGCSLCAKRYPDAFEMRNQKAYVKDGATFDIDQLHAAIRDCPAQAISSYGMGEPMDTKSRPY